MGMISKKGLGMHMGGVSTAKLQKEAHNQATNDDPFGDDYDPFASNGSTSSNSFEAMLKDTFGTDFDGLNKNMKPSDEEPIKKLKFGNGVTMTMLKLPQAPTPEPEQQRSPIESMPAPVPVPIPTVQTPQQDHTETITFPNGTTIHLCNGKLHRMNGPAIEFAGGAAAYFQDGKLHCTNGPAIYWPYEEDCQWFIQGQRILSKRETQSSIKSLRAKMLNSSPSKKKHDD